MVIKIAEQYIFLKCLFLHTNYALTFNIYLIDHDRPSIDLQYLPNRPITLESDNNENIQRHRRSRNSLNPSVFGLTSTKLSNNWPPISRDNWIKVMVVADGPMLKYHGEKLERYILTLMQTVNLSLFLNCTYINNTKLYILIVVFIYFTEY